MNILYLAHRIPYPPNKGDKRRAFRQIEHLSRRHRIWCACFIDDPRDFRHIQKLTSYCADLAVVELKPFCAKLRGLWSMAHGQTITEGFYTRREMALSLRRWQNKVHFDAIVAFSSSMAPYALQVSAPRRILDLCDLDSLKWQDYADHLSSNPNQNLLNRACAALYRKESARLAAAELRWIDGFDSIVLATKAEAAPLRELVAERKIHVIGNGVELPRLIDKYSQSSIDNRQSTIGPVVGFIGVMDYLPNIDAVTWFATQCWPAIRAQFATAQFRIVGRSPAKSVRKLVAIPGVQVVGEVPDITDELSRFDVSVAPLRIARGVQNKVLEAMAGAKPVVLTSKAAQGIGAVTGRDYLVADSEQVIAASVCTLLGDRELRATIGESARFFVAENTRWEREFEKLDALLAGGMLRSSSCTDFTTSSNRHIPSPIPRPITA